MVTPVAEKPLDDFRQFEEWLGEQQLLDSDILYRGHGNSTWALESTLYRHQRALFDARHPALEVAIGSYANAARRVQAIIETHTSRKFAEIIVPSHDYFPISNLQLSFRYVVYLRHHGLPSPLLDWSLSPYVAAYFAFVEATDSKGLESGTADGEPRIAIYVLKPPKHPYKDYAVGSDVLPGREAGIRYWPNPVKGETRHYDQQSAYTTAIRADPENDHEYYFGSHEYILRNFPQTLRPNTNVVTFDAAIDGAVCWKITIPQRKRASVLQRLDRMNINAYTLFRTEDTLVATYGRRELHRTVNMT